VSVFNLSETPVHLGLGATVEQLPTFDGSMQWYERYGAAHAADDAEGRLVAVHTFGSDWSTWEVHPNGEELLYVIAGKLTLIQDIDGEQRSVHLEAGDAAINPRGVWHTAKTAEPTTVLFITAGKGTLNETRDS
jgi:mannose-6-phosphate isomerase-like protein (cupin superfamily)